MRRHVHLNLACNRHGKFKQMFLPASTVLAMMRPAILLRMSVPPLLPSPSSPPPPPSGTEWEEQQRSRIEREESELAAEEAALAAFWAAEPPRRLALVGPENGPFCEQCGSRVPHEQTSAKLTIQWEPWMPAWMQGRRVYNCSCGHSGEYAAPPLARPGSAPLETANRAAEAATNGGGGSGGAATSDETRDSDAAATGGSSTWTYDWLVPPGADRDPAS
jgi:hypothetical protein